MRLLRIMLPLALLTAACQAPLPAAGPVPVVLFPSEAPAATASPAGPALAAATPGATPAATATPAAASTASPPTTPTPAATPAVAPLKLVAIGASDVVGLGASKMPQEGWSPVLEGLLAERAGRPFALTRYGALSRLAREMREEDLPKAVALKPDVVVVWTGTNDMRLGVTLEAFRADFDGLVAGLAATRAKVYVLNLPALDRLPFFQEHAEAYKAALPGWQAAIAQVAAAHGAKAIDLAAYSAEVDAHPEYLWIDGFHPTSAGYRRIAEIVAGAVVPDVAPLSLR